MTTRRDGERVFTGDREGHSIRHLQPGQIQRRGGRVMQFQKLKIAISPQGIDRKFRWGGRQGVVVDFGNDQRPRRGDGIRGVAHVKQSAPFSDQRRPACQ